MAKKKTTKKAPSKSQAVRDQLKKTPNAPASEIAAAASKASGLTITTSTVYNVKSAEGGATKKTNKKKAAKKTAKKTGSKAAPKQTSPAEDVKHAGELLFQAVELVMKAGYNEAKSMVEIAGKMVDRITDEKK